MREFKIAVANSRRSAIWKNTTVTWQELFARLQSTINTSETSEEYWSMTKKERDNIKDKGGFVGGYLTNGRRRITDVKCRTLITFDVDTPNPVFFDRFMQGFPYAAIIYTTHSHMPDRPRYRVVIALEEDITPDKYAAVSRYLAAELGIEQFDPVSFVVNQLMHWPSTSTGAEYICEIIDKPFLNADAFLAEHPGWQDYSKLPVSPREKPLRNPDGRLQEDPLTKDNIVGTFCRTYTIQEAIEKFLSNVYASTDRDDRYDYIPGEGTAGVVIYEDKFAFSHHATDPAGERRLNAFDLVRIHKFGDEEDSFRRMCEFAETDKDVRKMLEREKMEQAQKDFEKITSNWEPPIPFKRYEPDPFPVDALPFEIAAYVKAVAESTQTPVDMAGTTAISLISVCIQGKYVIMGKADWIEPLNTYITVIASPSERKSAILRAMAFPLNNYETQYNQRNAGLFELSKMQKAHLEHRRKVIVENVKKGKADEQEMERIAWEIANFEEKEPLRLYVDDITTEKLISIMQANKGHAALVSSEGGIFDTLAGIYTKNVNIDVMLKGYSGDTIRVDRVNRESQSILNPALTVFLMTQPKVIEEALKNKTFVGRGLMARFLFCLPLSVTGDRKFNSIPVPKNISQCYERKMIDMLEEEYPPKPEVITLSPEAFRLIAEFANEVESKLNNEYAEIPEWAGKLVGNTLRIAGLLCRAETFRASDFLVENEPLVVSEETMANAIRMGRYFLSHALAVFDVIPEENLHKQAKRVLQMLKEKELAGFDRRTALRNCRSFKTVAEIQPVLDFLNDYGYIVRLPDKSVIGGKALNPKYTVNPLGLEMCDRKKPRK